MTGPAEYARLLACYRSGQMTEAAWHEHLKDEGLRAWVSKQAAERCAPIQASGVRIRICNHGTIKLGLTDPDGSPIVEATLMTEEAAELSCVLIEAANALLYRPAIEDMH